MPILAAMEQTDIPDPARADGAPSDAIRPVRPAMMRGWRRRCPNCGSGPMLQVSNQRYVHNLTPEKVDELIEGLRKGEMPPFCSVTLPQDEDEMGGNRRSDVSNAETYETQPVARTLE